MNETIDIHIDIETYSEVDLKKSGVYVYAEHPSTEILVIAWSVGLGPINYWTPWGPESCPLKNLLDFWRAPNTLFHAWNANFERTLLCGPAGKKLGFSVLPINRFRCTMLLSASNRLPSGLDRAADALGFAEGKDTDGYRFMLRVSKPKTIKGKTFRYLPDPEDSGWLRFAQVYCPQDVELERSISVHPALRPLPPTEQEIYEVDQRINDAGLPFDVVSAAQIRDVLTREKKKMAFRMRGLTGLTPNQVEKLKKWLEDSGVESFDRLDKTAIQGLLQTEGLPSTAREVLHLRAAYAKASVSKYDAMVRSASEDGRVRGLYRQLGAEATGRWTSTRLQVHNLVRNTFKAPQQQVDVFFANEKLIDILWGEDIVTAGSRLSRAMIQAVPGHRLCVADYSAIEARITGFLARDPGYMQAYLGDGKLYEAYAARLFRCEIGEVNEEQRFLGKTIILGCGFQMGVDKFIATARAQGVAAPTELLTEGHQLYRDTFVDIVRLWGTLQKAYMDSIHSPGELFKLPRHGIEIYTTVRASRLLVKIPSGRVLVYWAPRVTMQPAPWDYSKQVPQIEYMGVRPISKSWGLNKIYGGKCVEHIVQASARDILARALLDAGKLDPFPIVGHTHDEVLELVPTEKAEEHARGMVNRMTRPLDGWQSLSDMPLKVEVKIQDRYGK